METPWMDIAKKEIGIHELRGGENWRILEFHASTTLHAKEDEVPWCSAFVTWCLQQAGYESTKSAWARSYCDYGNKTEPKYGAIMVFSRGSESGHVAFYLGEDDECYEVLGGNQHDSVCVAKYPKSKLLTARWPIKV